MIGAPDPPEEREDSSYHFAQFLRKLLNGVCELDVYWTALSVVFVLVERHADRRSTRSVVSVLPCALWLQITV